MKLTKFEKSFSALFFIIVMIELFSSKLSPLSSFHNVAKPLILLSLILFFFMGGRQLTAKTRLTMLLALTFSLVGDIFLMLDDLSTNNFLIGLVAFLLAHIMYIVVFLEKKSSFKKPIFLIAILLVYVLGLFYLLKDRLGNMLIPVVAYMLIIFTMAITASFRKGNVPKASYNLVLIGSLLFIVSDSFLAINKFYRAVPYEHIFIMSTYALAQYCIVMGVLKQKS